MYGDDDERVAKHPAYENLREESARREEEMLCYVDDLADLEEQLDQELTTKEEAMEIYKGEVERILNAIALSIRAIRKILLAQQWYKSLSRFRF